MPSDSPYELTDRQLCSRIWVRLQPYRRQLFLSIGLLVCAVPFINFHPLVWGFVADHLVAETLTAGSLWMW
ncbi:MAG: hypothetical protein AAGH89_08445, partial [Verrucomicrobiota bacterium]